jgi:integrase
MGRPRKLPDGLWRRGSVYYARFSANGRQVRKRLSTNLQAARTILNDLKARADKANFNLLDNDYPLADLKDEFLKYCRQTLRPATAARYKVCMANVVSKLAANRVCQIGVETILGYREGRLKEYATPRTINMEVTALGTMLRYGVKTAKIGSNPLVDSSGDSTIKPLPDEHPKKGRALTLGEVDRLLEHGHQPWRDVFYCLLVTGMRREELASLTFADVDWDSRELIIRSGVAKNHRARRVPVDNHLWEIVCRQRDNRTAREPGTGRTAKITERVRARFSRDHVFVSTQNTPLTHRSGLYFAFMRCCDRAGIQTRTLDAAGNVIEHVDVHSLRRTFATHMIESGADPKSVQELLGHRTLDMTMNIYAKVHAQTKRQALGKLSYGHGVLAPSHVVEYPSQEGFWVHEKHNSSTRGQRKKAT